jgi:hypothetical protein
MRIGAPEPKGTDSRAAGVLARWPGGKPGIYVEGTVREIDLGIGLFEVQAWWDHLVLERQDSLDEACYPGSNIQVSEVGLHRADGTEAFLRGMSAKCSGQRRDFNRIP